MHLGHSADARAGRALDRLGVASRQIRGHAVVDVNDLVLPRCGIREYRVCVSPPSYALSSVLIERKFAALMLGDVERFLCERIHLV